MDTRPDDLPDFEAPPLDEVALSVQFQPIQDLQTPQIGLLWDKYRDRFPITEQHQPLDPVEERFGPPVSPSVKFELSKSPPSPRCWFLDKESTELIQVQQDRFVHNWRKANENAEYPRYEHVREQFEQELDTFRDFLRTENLGDLFPNQCEVTYTNAISTERNISHGLAGYVLAPVSLDYSDDFLGEPENIRYATQYVFSDENGEPIGRLHVSFKPAFKVSDGSPIFVLNLAARGAPRGNETKDILDFFDIGREWIVRGFASITTPDMHEYWRRKDAKQPGNN